MKTQPVSYFELAGSYEEIGRQMARRLKEANMLSSVLIPRPKYISNKDLKDALKLYETYCPGTVEELQGFSKEAGIEVEKIMYTWMTYLVPRCSGLILLGSKTTDGHTKLVRNYEFSLEDEDLAVVRTAPVGKYSHIGGTIAIFGRCEGINECGLAVSMSSCGMPVGNMEGMRAPKVYGLHFWAVIRTLLENCKNVEEALEMVKDMPIAYNINLYLADPSHNGVLYETMDGKVAYERINETSKKQYLCGTNHIVIPKFQVNEPAAMRNSVVRFQALTRFVDSRDQCKEEEVKDFFLTKYPEGMSTCYYEDWFGTIRTVVMDTVERRFSICWFGQKENGWTDLLVNQNYAACEKEKLFCKERAEGKLFEFITY